MLQGVQTHGVTSAAHAYRFPAARTLLRTAVQPDQREAHAALLRRVCGPCERDDSRGLRTDDAHKVDVTPSYADYLERQNRRNTDPDFADILERDPACPPCPSSPPAPAETPPPSSSGGEAPEGRRPYAGPRLADTPARTPTTVETRLQETYRLRTFAPSGRLVDVMM